MINIANVTTSLFSALVAVSAIVVGLGIHFVINYLLQRQHSRKPFEIQGRQRHKPRLADDSTRTVESAAA